MVLQHAQLVPDTHRASFQMAYLSQRKDRTTALLLSVFLGHFGVDRFYIGQTGLGVAKLLTVGGCGVWTIVDWFLIMGATDACNREAFQKIATVYPALGPQSYRGPQSYGAPFG